MGQVQVESILAIPPPNATRKYLKFQIDSVLTSGLGPGEHAQSIH